MKRFHITVKGRVQGVGFRPTVYRVAHQLKLTGWVCNDAEGVSLEVQGIHADGFVDRLRTELPALAVIDSIQTDEQSVECNEINFVIKKSQSGTVKTKVSPDVCVCDDCLRELFDPASRFYCYPFLNCTHCGPRLTITHQLPYDRQQTAMADFPLCADCAQDYVDINNRRYHAQPTACAECGPQLSHSIEEIVDAIRGGKIVAVKGLGGYQLICDARQTQAVERLRERKKRAAKPFALMVLNTASARQIVDIDDKAEALLCSRQRPIVLLPKRTTQLSDVIAPGLSAWGVMLPYTPLHYLLFQGLLGEPTGHGWLNESQDTVLVVTSANRHGEPLLHDDDEAAVVLAPLADLVVSYNRRILTRADDSVLQMINDTPTFVRRARGYVPEPIRLAHAVPPVLALGGYLKNTVCVTRDDEAFVSQHIGDLDNGRSRAFLHETLTHLLKILDVKPVAVACDAHPDFYSTKIAAEFGLPVIPVQHHCAHVAAVAAEHHVTEPAIGVALDGYGYGENGEAWGGELFLCDHGTCQRLSHLMPLDLPGGDIAARQPWRLAASVLHRLGHAEEITRRFAQEVQAAPVRALLSRGLHCIETSSCGRWFDAASALLGVCLNSEYEAQAAMQLEALVKTPKVFPAGWALDKSGQLNLLPLFEHLLSCDPQEGADYFHGTLMAALADWIIMWAHRARCETVLLSGGCLLNRVLASGLVVRLREEGLRPLLPRAVPPNDGGLSLGQAWVAATTCLGSSRGDALSTCP